MAEYRKPTSSVKDVPIKLMAVSDKAQRVLRPAWVNELHSKFDPEDFGYPVLNFRNGKYFIVDGQHRMEALKMWLGEGWEKQNVTCRVYSGLSEKEEARMFDRLNKIKTVSAFDRFNVRVTAGEAIETAVNKIVEKRGLHVSQAKADGGMSAVSTLVKIYTRSNGETLSRSLGIVHTAFGDPGLTNSVIDGVARMCERYNGLINDKDAIEKLGSLRGGVGALLSNANLLKKQTGASTPKCVAAAVVDVLNRGRVGKKRIPSWWKE